MAEVLNVKVRDLRGKRNARRMRRAGNVPAVLYGHGEAVVSLVVPTDQVKAAIRHGARVVELQGDVKETAFVRELQWDTFGMEVLHLDLTRVSADDRVQVEVHIELRGEAPGTREGGVVTHLLHQVEVECPVTAIPEKILVSIRELKLGDVISAGDIELPQGVTLTSTPDAVVVQCLLPLEQEEPEAAVAGALEPEVIGRKAEGEEEEEE